MNTICCFFFFFFFFFFSAFLWVRYFQMITLFRHILFISIHMWISLSVTWVMGEKQKFELLCSAIIQIILRIRSLGKQCCASPWIIDWSLFNFRVLFINSYENVLVHWLIWVVYGAQIQRNILFRNGLYDSLLFVDKPESNRASIGKSHVQFKSPSLL